LSLKSDVVYKRRVSRLNDLLRELRTRESALARDLEREVAALADRRAFGLNFERHVPEAVELPGRKVRKGDKVRILTPRDQLHKRSDDKLWRAIGIDRSARTVHLEALAPPAPDSGEPAVDAGDAGHETKTTALDDLVVVAEFRDPIYPGLVSTGKIERGGNKPFHTVISAENFHALETLLFIHRGRVDCIYIDPPYNTGAKDWKYNNNYVESDDLYRHSKWLAMMERRLLLAKELLNPQNSVLIVAIDEREGARLGLLLEQLFPDSSIQMITVSTNKKGSSRPGRFSRTEEYLYFAFFGDAQIAPWRDNMLTEREADAPGNDKAIWNSLLRRGDEAARSDRPNMFYPVWADKQSKRLIKVGEPLPLEQSREDAPQVRGATPSWPLRSDGSEGRWQVGAPRLRQLVEAGYARAGAWNAKLGQHAVLFLKAGQITEIEEGSISVRGRDSDGSLILERSSDGPVDTSQAPRTMWVRDSHDASIYGSTLLRSLIPGRKFPFPKSLYAVEDALRFVTGANHDAIIVDFFAGSGTTAHAVMRLNKQDGGQRRTILVTNNEVAPEEQTALRDKGRRPGDPDWENRGICEYITEPRIEAAITGRTPDGKPIRGDYKFTDEFPMADGFEENAEFFTLTYEAPLRVASHREFLKIAPLLWIRAGARGRRIDDISAGWDVADVYGVLANLDHTRDFLRAVVANNGVAIAYIVSDEERLFEWVAQQLPGTVEPVRLYEAYLRNFEIESGRGSL
jgi:adenine-specific DNA-methyltransferase